MKNLILLISFLIVLTSTSTVAQSVKLSNLQYAELTNGEWSNLKPFDSKIEIEFSGQPGVYTLRISDCSMEMIKFVFSESGKYLYEPMSRLMGGELCDKSYSHILLEKSLDEFIKQPSGTINIFYDSENRKGIAYKVE